MPGSPRGSPHFLTSLGGSVGRERWNAGAGESSCSWMWEGTKACRWENPTTSRHPLCIMVILREGEGGGSNIL